jgi:NADH-quinone oxidoreductase subunit M
MNELHFPWLLPAILTPLIGAIVVGRVPHEPEAARKRCIVFAAITLALLVGAWVDFSWGEKPVAGAGMVQMPSWLWPDVLAIDELNAPLLPMVALVYLLTTVATLRTKIRRFSFAWTLCSESIAVATLSCESPWALIGLLALGTLPPLWELHARGKSLRVYSLHMALFVVLLVLGWSVVEIEGANRLHSLWAVVPLLTAIFIRTGIAPFHCWMTDLFEHATFGTALVFSAPIMGAYAAVRLVLPIAPDWVLANMGLLALATAVYAAGMALVQREGRRFFCYLFLSHSALVLVGLEILTPVGLAGALCVWLSAGLSLAGFGLTLRAVEARTGRLSLTEYHGLYEHAPSLAVCFLATGLACVGFPGTFGFVGTELLVDGAVVAYPYVGAVVVFASALNGIAIVQTYLRLFTGKRHVTSVPLGARRRERFAVLTLTLIIFGGGLYPQPGVQSRYAAATRLLEKRAALLQANELAERTAEVAQRD